MIFNILISSNSPRDKFILIVSFLFAVVGAIVIHEFAHAFVAVKNGDMTPKLAGRMTLNPRAHFDLFGMLMFLLIGFGWAKPVPINPDNFEHKKKGMLTTALAGITANLIMALIWLGLFSLLALIPLSAVYKTTFGEVTYNLFFYFFYYSIMLSCSLMLFNLLPVYPLDGFRVVETLSKPGNKYVNFMYKYGNWSLIVLLIIANFIPERFNMFSLFLGEVQKLIWLIFSSIVG